VIFPYSSIISPDPSTGDFLLVRRPEIPVTILGAAGAATYIGLVDTGSDHTIFLTSVADHLGIQVQEATGPAASVFGGQRIQLLVGEAVLKLEAGGQTSSWKTVVCFFDFTTPEEEAVVLGHAGFLDYFTAIFDGKAAVLSLEPNDELPPAA
jgi:hypothetical protein